LRLVIRELARLTRDLLVVSVDPSRLNDPEIAAESEREALRVLAPLFSHEDLMRAFDVLTKAEYDIRASLQPRYHLELALLRWVHLRRLVPLSDIIQGIDKGGSSPRSSAAGPAPRPAVKTPSSNAATVRAIEASRAEAKPQAESPASVLKDALLAEIQKTKKLFYGTVVAQAQRIDVQGDRIVLTFGPQHRIFKQQLEQNRPWLEELASRLAGRPMTVVGADGDGTPPSRPGDAARAASPASSEADKQTALKQKAMADSGVQAMLDVFRTDIKEVEEM